MTDLTALHDHNTDPTATTRLRRPPYAAATEPTLTSVAVDVIAAAEEDAAP